MQKREQIDAKCKWNLADIYADESQFEREFEQTKGEIATIAQFKGRLSEETAIYGCLSADEKVSKKLGVLYCYAQLANDLDIKDNASKKRRDKVSNLYVEYSEISSFIMPELSQLDDGFLRGMLNDNRFANYDYFIELIIKNKPHILTEKEESLLAQTSEIFDGFHQVFNMLDNAELRLGSIKDSAGENIQLTHGAYSVLMQGKDRVTRVSAFNEYYTAYEQINNTLATVYYNALKADWFYAKARGYESCLQASLSGNDVSEVVYGNLIDSVNGNLNLLHKYTAIKSKALNYGDFAMYDMSVPLLDSRFEKDYEQAYDIVIEGLSVLGEEYVGLLKKAREERWLDVYETQAKRSGAYSMGVYGIHPYVLLNYQKTTHDIFTIAHELGHSMHSYYSDSNQPYVKADYKIFVAEVASTVNEVLLIKHLQTVTKDEQMKVFLTNYLLEMVRTTLFRQTQFAEFEVIVHGEIENGTPLTADDFNDIYLKLNRKYYGEAVTNDNNIQYEWSRIPHFYRSFYVYQYATGIISAIAIASNILENGDRAIEQYKAFLSSGGSDSPVELLKIAGVDLTSKQPFEQAMAFISKTIDEFDKTMNR